MTTNQNQTGSTTLDREDGRKYVCGEHFCEGCGDCMTCTWDYLCYDGEPHYCEPEEEDE